MSAAKDLELRLEQRYVDHAYACLEAMRQQEARPQPAPSPEEWKRRFDDYLHEVAARAGRYPEGFVLDDSRETIYEGRGG